VVVSAVDAEVITVGGSDFAIDRITVAGRVAYANFLAGFDLNGGTDNADASIGPVKVGGNWALSNLVAGAQDSSAIGYGVGDTLQTVSNGALIARIAGITIAGKVVGSESGTRGFVSQQIDFLGSPGRRFRSSMVQATMARSRSLARITYLSKKCRSGPRESMTNCRKPVEYSTGP
jgi:hypothetical protein